jgi:hypothetical protein
MSRTGQSAGQRRRKTQVLTHETASFVRSITNAVVVKNGEPFFICPPEANLPLDERHGFGLYLRGEDGDVRVDVLSVDGELEVEVP